jgi:hypothetical protein
VSGEVTVGYLVRTREGLKSAYRIASDYLGYSVVPDYQDGNRQVERRPDLGDGGYVIRSSRSDGTLMTLEVAAVRGNVLVSVDLKVSSKRKSADADEAAMVALGRAAIAAVHLR